MPAQHAVARPLTWATAALLSTATALGLWFGVSAPDISPVAAPAVAAAVQNTPPTAPDQQATDGGGGPRADGPQDGPGRGGDGGGRNGGGGGRR